MSSFRDRFANLTVGQALELNEAARRYQIKNSEEVK